MRESNTFRPTIHPVSVVALCTAFLLGCAPTLFAASWDPAAADYILACMSDKIGV